MPKRCRPKVRIQIDEIEHNDELRFYEDEEVREMALRWYRLRRFVRGSKRAIVTGAVVLAFTAQAVIMAHFTIKFW